MTEAQAHDTPAAPDVVAPPPAPVAALRDHLRIVLEETLQEDHVGAARDLGQLKNLFEDVVRDLNRVLSALQAPTPDPAALAMHLVAVLQFEDIASQVVQRARARLSLLEGFTSDLLADTVEHTTCPRADGPQGGLQDELSQRITQHRDRRQAALQRGVRQQSMDPGEIVLFGDEESGEGKNP